jgi:hypothetical protein
MSGPIILVGLRGVDQARENDWIKLVRSDSCAHLDLATVAMNRHTLWWARRCSTGHLLRDFPCAVERYRRRSQCCASSYTAFIATTDSVARPI